MYLEIHVTPNSKKTSIEYLGGNKLKVKVKSKAEDNKANIELISLLSDKFGCSFRIVRGGASRKKVLQTDLDEKAFLEALGSL